MNPESVAVVIPTHGGRWSLDAAVKSALDQSVVPREVVVVDDGSPEPAAVGDDLLERGVRLLRLPENLGPAAARNYGAEQTTARYLAFLDDDDRWQPDKLKRQLELASGGSRLISCDYIVVPERGRSETFFVPRDDAEFQSALLLEPTLPPSTVMVDREVFLGSGGFDPSMRMMEDWDLWVKLASSSRYLAVPEVLVRKSAHRGAASEILHFRRRMTARIHPSVEALPRKQKRKVTAHHATMEALLLLESGNKGKAISLLCKVVARSPSRVALQGLIRSVVGQATWSYVQRLKRGTPRT